MEQVHGETIAFLGKNGYYLTSKKKERSLLRPPPPTMKVEQIICHCLKMSYNDVNRNGTCSVCNKRGAKILADDGICVCSICTCDCNKLYKVSKWFDIWFGSSLA